MSGIKVLLSICAGTLVYVLMSVTFGRNGVWATDQLEEQKQIISVHTAELLKVNNSLSLEYTALKQDADVVAAYARKLGYVKEGEKLVKINGLNTGYVPLYDAGTVLKSLSPVFVPEWMCKMVGGVFGLLLFVIFVMKDVSAKQSFKREKNVFSESENTGAYETIAGIKVECL